MGMEKCNILLSELVGCRAHVVRRGSLAIRMALRYAYSLGCRTLYIPDMGGWITYEKDGVKQGFTVRYFSTVDGKFDPALIDSFDSDSVLLVHSLAGYWYGLPMEEIVLACRKKNIFVINDVAGSIGSDIARYGDVFVGSFGKWKPLNVGEGGFIASGHDDFWQFVLQEYCDDFSPSLDYDLLVRKITNLDTRRSVLINKCAEIAQSLKMHGPLNDLGRSIVVIVPFSSIEEKASIIAYCDGANLSYTLCPRYIRVMRDAVSIEVKRLG